MKYYDRTEHTMGLDWHARIAQNIVDSRKRAGMTQEGLAKKLGWKTSRVSAAENVRIRLKLDDVKALAHALDVELGWLICEQMDANGKDCMYLVWVNRHQDIKIYRRAKSAQMAYFMWYESLRKSVIVFDGPREFAKVKLVGIPITADELKTKFRKGDPSYDEELPGANEGEGSK